MARHLSTAAAAAAAVLAIAGCGGRDKPENTPKGAVEAVIAGIEDGDFKLACDWLALDGAELDLVIDLAASEQDDFGKAKDCPATLEKHADEAKELVDGADPDKVLTREQDSRVQADSQRVVTSPKGDWLVANDVETDDKGRWVVYSFPSRTRAPGNGP